MAKCSFCSERMRHWVTMTHTRVFGWIRDRVNMHQAISSFVRPQTVVTIDCKVILAPTFIYFEHNLSIATLRMWHHSGPKTVHVNPKICDMSSDHHPLFSIPESRTMVVIASTHFIKIVNSFLRCLKLTLFQGQSNEGLTAATTIYTQPLRAI